jgi:hypothetical protein
MHCLQVICPQALAKKKKKEAWLIGQAFFMGLAREPGLYGLGAWIPSRFLFLF